MGTTSNCQYITQFTKYPAIVSMVVLFRNHRPVPIQGLSPFGWGCPILRELYLSQRGKARWGFGLVMAVLVAGVSKLSIGQWGGCYGYIRIRSYSVGCSTVFSLSQSLQHFRQLMFLHLSLSDSQHGVQQFLAGIIQTDAIELQEHQC